MQHRFKVSTHTAVRKTTNEETLDSTTTYYKRQFTTIVAEYFTKESKAGGISFFTREGLLRKPRLVAFLPGNDFIVEEI